MGLNDEFSSFRTPPTEEEPLNRELLSRGVLGFGFEGPAGLTDPSSPGTAEGLRLSERAELAGVSTKGGPAVPRALSSLAPQRTLEVTQTALSQFFGQEIDVRVGDKTNEIEFRDPQTGVFTLLDEPGLSLSDIGELVGPAITLGSELAGGALGTLTPAPIVGTITGAGLGAAAGEFARLKMAQKIGLMPGVEDEELARRAALTGGIALAGGLAVRGIIRMGKSIFTRQIRMLKGTPTEAQSREFAKKVAESAEIEQGARELLGRDLKLTAGQVAPETEVGAQFFALEKSLSRNIDAGEPLRRAAADQRIAFNDMFQEAGRRAGIDPTDADAFTVGDKFQTAVNRRLSKIDQKLTAQTSTAQSRVGKAVEKNIIQDAAAGNTREFGLALKSIAQKEQREFTALEAKAYTELDEMFGALGADRRVPLQPILAGAKKADRIVQSNVFKQLDEFDRRIIQDALKLDDLTPAQVQGTIAALRRAERSAEQGLTPDVNLAVIRKLKSGFLNARSQFLRDKPVLAAKVEEVERFVRTGKEALDRSIVGDIVKVRGGREVVVPEKVFDKIIRPNNATESARLANILRTPQGKLSAADQELYDRGWEGMRAGIKELYVRKVLKDGSIVPSKHKEFMRQFRETIEPFFSKEELKRIKDLGNLELVVQASEKRRTALLAQANKTFPGRLASFERPRQVFEEVWTKGDVNTIDRFLRTASKDPQLEDLFKGVANKEIERKIAGRAGGNAVLDFNKLSNVIRDDGAKIERLFGAGYLKDLKTLEKTLAQVKQKPLIEVASPEAVPALRHVVRAYLGLFTRPGRLFTAGIRVRARSAEQAMARALGDPQSLARLVALRSEKLSSQATAEVLGGAGAYSLFSTDAP